MDFATTYNLNNGQQISVPKMMGSSTQIEQMEDGNYLVTTRGSRLGATPKTTVMSADELVEKYSSNGLERTPSQDTFQLSNKSATSNDASERT